MTLRLRYSENTGGLRRGTGFDPAFGACHHLDAEPAQKRTDTIPETEARMRSIAIALIALATTMGAVPALAQSIEGQWRVQNGETVTFRPCPQGFCSVIDTGKFAGGSVGWMAPSGGRYVGQVIDPESGKAYEGHASVEADRLTLTGCVAKVFCRSQNWTR